MTIRIADSNDLKLFMQIRLETLREVNTLPHGYIFSDEILRRSEEYFTNGNHTTVLAFNDDNEVIGCATICYINVMPTFSHPTGKRSHLMNVYTNKAYRRQGIAMQMMRILIDEAKEKGATEISLDATKEGRALYKKFGFTDSDECMVLNLN